MNTYEFEKICKNLIIDYVDEPIDITDVYVVWMCKTLKNTKALLSTTLPDLKYYECTYNGEKDEIYFDVYTKLENKVIASNQFKREVKLKNE